MCLHLKTRLRILIILPIHNHKQSFHSLTCWCNFRMVTMIHTHFFHKKQINIHSHRSKRPISHYVFYRPNFSQWLCFVISRWLFEVHFMLVMLMTNRPNQTDHTWVRWSEASIHWSTCRILKSSLGYHIRSHLGIFDKECIIYARCNPFRLFGMDQVARQAPKQTKQIIM